MNARQGLGLHAAIGGLVALLSAPAQAAEEQTVDAFSAWQGRSQIYATGKSSAVAMATLAGQVYVQTPEGPVYAGEMQCPGMLDVNTQTGLQSGSGHCLITAKDGARIFATWSCKGTLMIGCDGDFAITEGTGRFEGVTGGGPILVRSGVQELVVNLQTGTVDRTATGIVVWRGLRYKLP